MNSTTDSSSCASTVGKLSTKPKTGNGQQILDLELLQLKEKPFITCPNPSPGRPGVMGATLGQEREQGPLSHIHSGGETAAQHPTANSKDYKGWGTQGENSSLVQHLPWKVRFL